ncbi:type II CRISPR-associated endonuclease Cas1 [Roseimaritima sediminicola]|uniref:type II CRISPR-associated endonuclease Cas1 n=1 Tax=Roseimaritima sediminicola TaxID=2662066 RepID=UPI001298367D|nr:type II CRISPR-associated endonuclease Cas1 [Roseimaritima sediminicola]
MRNRIIEIAEHPAGLSIRHRQLIIDSQGRETHVPVDDISAVIVAHPQVRYTQAVISSVTESGGMVITCDANRMPSAMLLPLSGNTLQAERFQLQLSLTRPQQKRMWQQLIRRKIDAQAAVLRECHGQDSGLSMLARQVKSGDPQNVESTAAQRYWPRLFGAAFRRDRDAPGLNQYLNYGYAVLRSMVARGIAGSGLHPSIGIHHHNKYNPFCLADDLMEPFRPLVDRQVFRLSCDLKPSSNLDRTTRIKLIEILQTRLMLGGRNISLFDALSALTASVVRVAEGDRSPLAIYDGWV